MQERNQWLKGSLKERLKRKLYVKLLNYAKLIFKLQALFRIVEKLYDEAVFKNVFQHIFITKKIYKDQGMLDFVLVRGESTLNMLRNIVSDKKKSEILQHMYFIFS